MSRVTLSLLAAAAMSVAAAGTANAQCCGSSYNPAVYYSGGCCNTGFNTFAFAGTGCCNTGYVVQAAPVVVQAAPVVVQQPVVVRQPVIVQQQPVVQQYVVNQGPVYAGPALTDYRAPTWYAPRAVGAYPYVAPRWRYGYHRAHYGPRPYWHARRAYYRHHHLHHDAPISVRY